MRSITPIQTEQHSGISYTMVRGEYPGGQKVWRATVYGQIVPGILQREHAKRDRVTKAIHADIDEHLEDGGLYHRQ